MSSLNATFCNKPLVLLEAENQGESLKITVYLEPSLTLPPACPLTAKQKRVDSSAFPSILNCAKLAACPSMGWDTFLSTEYSCIAPTTRFCYTKKEQASGKTDTVTVISFNIGHFKLPLATASLQTLNLALMFLPLQIQLY